MGLLTIWATNQK